MTKPLANSGWAAHQPLADRQLEEILDKFFILRQASVGDDLAELKARNEAGEPKQELQAELNAYFLQQVLDLLPPKKSFISIIDGKEKFAGMNAFDEGYTQAIDDITKRAKQRFGGKDD